MALVEKPQINSIWTSPTGGVLYKVLFYSASGESVKLLNMLTHKERWVKCATVTQSYIFLANPAPNTHAAVPARRMKRPSFILEDIGT